MMRRFVRGWYTGGGGSMLAIALASGVLGSAPLLTEAPPNIVPPKRLDAPQGQPARPEREGQERRRNEPLTPVVRIPPGVEFVADVVYATALNADGSDHQLLMDTFFPREDAEELLPAIIYIHGGGFTSGSKEVGNQYSVVLASGGYFTASIDYRLVGDAPLPAAMHDCKAAVRFLRANAEELGIDPERIAVWGHSAGGHLAAFLGVTGGLIETEGDVGEQSGVSSHVKCVVDFFGPTDFPTLFETSRQGEELRPRIFGGDASRSIAEQMKHASPSTYVSNDDSPFLIIHGTEDRLVPLSQSQTFHEALTKAGVASEFIAVEGAGHGIRDPEIMVRVATFFDTHLGGRAADAVAQLLDRLPAGRRNRDANGGPASQDRRRNGQGEERRPLGGQGVPQPDG